MFDSLIVPFVPVYDYPDAYFPEMWANESIAILQEAMVVGNLVHRDFEPAIANYGDVVNTRKPGEFTVKRKTANDNVTVQTPTATNVPVVLNQHLHTSFLIKDGDQSKAFKDLVAEYLSPAMLSVARGIDQILMAQTFQFLPNVAGKLGGVSGSTAQSYLLGTRQVMNQNKALVDGRHMIVGPVAETALLSDPAFLQAYSVGDEGTALREASLGRKFGYNIFMAQNTPYSLATATDKVTGAVNNAAGYVAGIKTFTVDGLSAAISNGSWITIAGDATPLQVVSTVGGATPTSITVAQGLKSAVLDNAVVTIWGVGQVNQGGGYALGYAKEITYDTFTADPQVGQAVTFGTSTVIYGIIAVDTTGKTILLDRPLEATLADDAKINLLPAGSYNFAFHKNALALVTRPLALPMPGTGARAGVANFGGFSMRVVMTYDGNKQGTLVTLDTLLGVKVLETSLGAIMLG
jgi:hypothetical protein